MTPGKTSDGGETQDEPLTLLLVDDDATVLDSFDSYVSEIPDITAIPATSGEEAHERVANHEIDCLVADPDALDSHGAQFVADVRRTVPDCQVIWVINRDPQHIDDDVLSSATTIVEKGDDDEDWSFLVEKVRGAVEHAATDHESEEIYRRLVETAGDGLYRLDANGEVMYLNEAFASMLGYDREALIGVHASTVMREGELERGQQVVQEVLSAGDSETALTEMEMVTREGDPLTVSVHFAVLTTEDGAYDGLVGVVRDITDRKERERELEKLRRRYELVVQASTDAFWDWRPGEEVMHRSEEFLSQFGYEPADIESRFSWWEDRIHPDDREHVLEAVANALENPDVSFDETYRFRRKDGRYGHIRTRAYVVHEEHGTPERMVGAHVDVSDLKARERQLERQNKRLEEFASVLSHDLRNPLNVATGNLQLARETGDEANFEAAQQALDRMDELIDDLLSLAQHDERVSDVEPVNLAELVANCWRNVQTEVATLAVETDHTIRADKSRLAQLVENLFRNAIEHGGPEVTVQVGDLDNGFYVADDGPGIPSRERNQVFNSGYSTAETGTGFGLAIVREIVEAHGWQIEVTESEAGGAQFEITGVEIGQ